MTPLYHQSNVTSSSFFSSELLAKLRGLSQVHQDQGSRLRPVQTVLEDVLVALP